MFIILISKFSELNDNNKMFNEHGRYQPINIERLHEFYFDFYYAFRILLTPYGTRHEDVILNHKLYFGFPNSALKQCILSNIYPIYSIKTIKKFNLEITENYIITLLHYKNKTVLEWLINNKPFILQQLGYYEKILKFLKKN